ncbi:MAG TPA: hypothetical protein VGC19_09315 [Rhodanobacter sp.]
MGKGYGKARDRSRQREQVRAGRRPLELTLADDYRREGNTVTRLEHEQSTCEFEGIDLLLRLGDRFVVAACRDRLPPLFHHEIQALPRRLPQLGANGPIIASLDTFDLRARELGGHFPGLQLLDGALLRILLGDAATDALRRGLQAGCAVYLPPTACRRRPRRRHERRTAPGPGALIRPPASPAKLLARMCGRRASPRPHRSASCLSE